MIQFKVVKLVDWCVSKFIHGFDDYLGTKMVKISSKNQQGGITAQNVNSVTTEQQPKSSVSLLIKIILGTIGLVGSVLTIVQYFDIKIT